MVTDEDDSDIPVIDPTVRISRREMRIAVMKAVFACMASGNTAVECFEQHLREFSQKVSLQMQDKKGKVENDLDFIEKLYFGTINSWKEYIELLSKFTNSRWNISRTHLIDKVILTLALHEIKTMESIPVQISINEYLEIAKLYSSPESPQFLNGILDRTYYHLLEQGQVSKIDKFFKK
ncbi:MAG: transcription antitermination factor NusB [Bacteroidia bacterium]|nr:transcription antitermination factor NusB [Bacteroidia bacterium]